MHSQSTETSGQDAKLRLQFSCTTMAQVLLEAYWKPWFSALPIFGMARISAIVPGSRWHTWRPLSARPEPATLGGVPCALLFSLLDAMGEPSVALCGLDWGAGVALEAAFASA